MKYCNAAGDKSRGFLRTFQRPLNSAHPLSSDIYIDKGNTMHMLYDSESFVVVHMLPDAVEKKSTQVLNDTAPASVAAGRTATVASR